MENIDYYINEADELDDMLLDDFSSSTVEQLIYRNFCLRGNKSPPSRKPKNVGTQTMFDTSQIPSLCVLDINSRIDRIFTELNNVINLVDDLHPDVKGLPPSRLNNLYQLAAGSHNREECFDKARVLYYHHTLEMDHFKTRLNVVLKMIGTLKLHLLCPEDNNRKGSNSGKDDLKILKNEASRQTADSMCQTGKRDLSSSSVPTCNIETFSKCESENSFSKLYSRAVNSFKHMKQKNHFYQSTDIHSKFGIDDLLPSTSKCSSGFKIAGEIEISASTAAASKRGIKVGKPEWSFSVNVNCAGSTNFKNESSLGKPEDSLLLFDKNKPNDVHSDFSEPGPSTIKPNNLIDRKVFQEKGRGNLKKNLKNESGLGKPGVALLFDKNKLNGARSDFSKPSPSTIKRNTLVDSKTSQGKERGNFATQNNPVRTAKPCKMTKNFIKRNILALRLQKKEKI